MQAVKSHPFLEVYPMVICSLLLLFIVGCSQSQNAIDPVESVELTRASLRAPRPSIHPERKAYRPRLVLRDSPGVRRALQEYLGKRRPFLEDAFSRYELLNPDFARIFTYYGIPVEVSNLAIIESRLVVGAKSRRGAVGLWQFMPATAKRYGLSVGIFKDERKDPVLSTVAAARYLSELHNRFGDWFLALAAYNCGPSRLSRVIKREGTSDFFELAQRKAVSLETRLLVARFVAVTMILRNKETYGFSTKAK